MKDLTGDMTSMATAELKELLTGLRADLEEVEEERMFVLGQTGVHISASTVARYESELSGLSSRIEEAELALRSRSPEGR